MGCFCNWGNDGVAPVIMDLGALEGEVKNVGECRGYVVNLGFKGDKYIKPLSFG